VETKLFKLVPNKTIAMPDDINLKILHARRYINFLSE
jgi:hypothetical protein